MGIKFGRNFLQSPHKQPLAKCYNNNSIKKAYAVAGRSLRGQSCGQIKRLFLTKRVIITSLSVSICSTRLSTEIHISFSLLVRIVLFLYLQFVSEEMIQFCRQYYKENTNSKITKSSLIERAVVLATKSISNDLL